MNGSRVSPSSEPNGKNMTTAIEMQPAAWDSDKEDVDPHDLSRRQSRANNFFTELPSRSKSVKDLGRASSVRRRSGRRQSNYPGQSRENVEVVNMDTVDGAHEDTGQTVRSLPVPMRDRRQFKNSRKQKPLKTISCWKSFKLQVAMAFSSCTSNIKEGIHSLELWKGHLKQVEGQFGNGVLSYFVFLKWLLFLNLAIFFLMFGFVSLPTIIIQGAETDLGKTTNINGSVCHAIPNDRYTNKTVADLIVDFISGQGWINTTIMFYSNYPSQAIISQDDVSYDLPLAYLFVGGSYFLLSLILMMRNLSANFQESYIEGGGSFYSFCNKAFASWDYCTMDENAAKIKHQSIVQDINAELAEEKRMERVANRTTFDKCKLYFVRIFISFICIVLLGLSVWAIYVTVEISTNTDLQQGEEPIVQILIRSSPSLTITALNIILPTLFEILSGFEDWSPRFQVAVNLYRSVLLKIASLTVLIITLYIDIESNKSCTKSWENEIAAQMYMLIWTDFVVMMITTVIVETLRKLLYKYTNFFKKIGMPQFQITKNVLDLVYGQCLIWIGAFFSPLIPSMGVVKLVIMFYVKKTSLIYNNKPSEKPYQGARSNYLFTMLLLLTFVLCLVGVGWGVTKVHPSCHGAFSNTACQLDKRMLDTLSNEILTWPSVLQEIIRYISTAAFIFPALLIFCLLLYYFRSMSRAHVKMINMLRDQLVLEGRDKKYLMEKLIQEAAAKNHDGNESDDTQETTLQRGSVNF